MSEYDLLGELNRAAGTTGLGFSGACNALAGTTGLEGVGALNAKAGTSGLDLDGVLNRLAGTTGLGPQAAARLIYRTNLLKYPSAESGTTGWTASGGTIAQSAAWSASGTYSYRLTATGGDVYAYTAGAARSSVVAGSVFTASATLRSDATPRVARITVWWIDAGSGYLTSTNGDQVTTSTTADVRATLTATAPASAVSAEMYVTFISCAAAEVHYFDAAMIEASPTAGTYFDGSFPNCRWTGTANASTSQNW